MNHHIPALAGLFQIRDLSLADCTVTLLLGLIPVTVLELTKPARRAWRHDANRAPKEGMVRA